MSIDHELWLQKQGVKIVNQRTLHRASMPQFYHQDLNSSSNLSRDTATFTTTTEQVYQVELDERTLDRLQRNDSLLLQAMDYAGRLTRPGQFNSNGVTQYFIDNSNRHYELLKENSMYRDAWKEFQTIRVLLGETPHWP